MIQVNEIVKDNILHLQFNDMIGIEKTFEIISQKTNKVYFKGSINGRTKSACYFVGDWPKGEYQLKSDSISLDFKII
jgi:hypothetical protein